MQRSVYSSLFRQTGTAFQRVLRGQSTCAEKKSSIADIIGNTSREVGCLQTLKELPLSSAQGATVRPLLKPERYASANSLQRRHNNAVLDFCQSTFIQDTDDTTRILDVGSGTGDFTRDCLLPRCLPCQRMIGTDCSWDMVQYARQHSSHEKLEYHLLDINGDVTDFVRRHGRFDRLYSFYCIHWLKDPAIALKNIAELLTHKGEYLLLFSACHCPAAVWTLMAKMERWAKYSDLLLEFVPDSHFMRSKQEQFSYMQRLLHNAGLAPSILALPRMTLFDNSTENDIIRLHLGINPLYRIVSEEEREHLVRDVTRLVREVHGPTTDQSRYRMYIIKASISEKHVVEH
ncbi:juvenile hormone acid O-methyltransferase-like [Haemaphysalis longicornis]